MTLAAADDFGKLKPYVHEAAEMLRLLGNASRLQLLCQLAEGEHSVSQLEREVDIKQPALSQQLAELRKAGIVQTRRESRSVFYSLDDARVRAVLDLLRSIHCGGQPPAPLPAGRPAPDKLGALPAGDAARFAKLEK